MTDRRSSPGPVLHGATRWRSRPKNTICLWFDGDAEDAARFYAEHLSRLGRRSAVHRAPGDFPSGKKGDVLTVEFTVLGIPCVGLNGGPAFKHSEAFSFQVATDDQAETGPLLERDRRQRRPGERVRLVQGQVGRVAGRSRRVALTEAVTDADAADAKRAFEAMMTMKKIDVAAIEAARRG